MFRTDDASPRRTLLSLVIAMLAVALFVAGCSSDDNDDASNNNTDASEIANSDDDGASGEAASDVVDDTPVLRILVSNDDGFDSPGIDALVTTLSALPNVEVIVAAPASEQSGSGSSTTDGALDALVVVDAETASSFPVFSVDGFPADSINWALAGNIEFSPSPQDNEDADLTRPHVVITGINHGQNVGAIADQVSGTVGAARAAAAQGIPALATSLGINFQDDYDATEDFVTAAEFVAEWITKHREALLDGSAATEPVLLENYNFPACSDGEARGLVEVEMSDQTNEGFIEQDCTSDLASPHGDIEAFNHGFATLSTLPLEPFTTIE